LITHGDLLLRDIATKIVSVAGGPDEESSIATYVTATTHEFDRDLFATLTWDLCDALAEADAWIDPKSLASMLFAHDVFVVAVSGLTRSQALAAHETLRAMPSAEAYRGSLGSSRRLVVTPA
jgi:hypothetical protein